MPIGVVDGTGTSATVNFVHADALGSPRAVTNSTGTALWQWVYASNPFGENAPTSSVGYTLNLRFPGQYFDAESGLSYNINRDYETATGRYVQSDPIGLAGGVTTFAYGRGRPLNNRDSTGLMADPPPPPEETLPENIPEVQEEIDELNRQEMESRPPPGGPYIPLAYPSSWGQAGECLRPEVEPPAANMSPTIDPRDFAGRTPQEIDSLAKSHGLVPKGPDPMNGLGGYIDPVTGAQRILSHGYDDPPHMHVNDPSGQHLDIHGNPVDPNSPEAHLPIGQP